MEMINPHASSLVQRLRELLNIQAFDNWDNPTSKSVAIEILINLSDLLLEADRMGNRIDFTDDVPIRETPKIRDVTDFIIHFRHGAAHTTSQRRSFFGNDNHILGKVEGKQPYMEYKNVQGDTVVLETKYYDDTGLIMGNDVLYLQRHLYRACKELFAFFDPHLS